MKTLFFDDVSAGQVFETDEHQVSLAEIMAFATEFDPQAIHLDDEAAEEGPFGEIIASGWHTLSLTMKLMAVAKPFGENPLIGVGVKDIEFKKPVFPETTIRVRATVTTTRKSSKGERGFVSMNVETQDAMNGETYIRQTWTVLVPTG